MKNLYIVFYSHRHGNDVWPVFSDTPVSPKEEAEKLEDFEPEYDEYIEVFGPFDPKAYCADST